MEYLHSLNYVHFNLKPGNILLDDYLHPKITGLEEAKKPPEEYTPNAYFFVKNRTAYHAPEYSNNENNCSARDVFSFAMIAYHILTNEEPYAGLSTYKISQLFDKEERPVIKNNIPDCYRKLIEKCWVQNPDERPTFEEIILNLRSNKDFITETIDKKEYENYINYIESNKTKILNSNEILNDFLETQSNTFRKIKIKYNQLRKEPIVHFSINIGSINLNRYSKKTKIGSGSFGNVYTVINKETEEVYAAKVSIYELDQCSDDIIMNLSREVEIMSNIKHPSVLRFFGYSPSNFKNKMKPVIVTEYAACGSLDTIIELERNNYGNHEWNSTKKLINLYGIAAGMMYLHKIGIVHRDLKPANILLDEMLYPKIADFGLSKKLKNEKDDDNDSVVVPSGFKGTYAYCSPEIIFQHEYSFKGDVYAYGMIAYEIMTNEIPFENCNYYQVIDKLYRGFVPEFNYPIPYCYRNLIQKCLSKETYNRPNFNKIVKMLEKERGFITPDVDEDEYFDYISLIKQSNEESTHNQQNDKQNKEVIKIELKSIENKELIKNHSNLKRIVETEDKQDNKNTEKNENEIFLKLNNFERENIINKSYLFKTYEFKDKENGMKYIGQMSMIKIKSFSDENIEYLKDKMSILLKINHPSLLKFIGLSPVDFKKQKKPVIITEYSSNGTLLNILEIERDGKIIEGWNYTKKMIILYGIAAAMLYLHSLDFVHCSLDPENIFLDDLLTPKLGYFGLLKPFFKEDQMSHQSMSGFNNTTVYCSPEVIKNNEYSKAGDVYAFAFIMFEILAKEKPFCGKNMNQIINEVIVKRNRPEMNEKILPGCKNLIDKCWSDDPNERPSFGDILNFLKNDKEILNNLEGKDKDDFIKYVKFLDSSEST